MAAEELFSKKGYETKSAGLSSRAKNKLGDDLMRWADIVFVMEGWQEEEIIESYPEHKGKVHCLCISGLRKGDPELDRLLSERVEKYLNE